MFAFFSLLDYVVLRVCREGKGRNEEGRSEDGDRRGQESDFAAAVRQKEALLRIVDERNRAALAAAQQRGADELRSEENTREHVHTRHDIETLQNDEKGMCRMSKECFLKLFLNFFPSRQGDGCSWFSNI